MTPSLEGQPTKAKVAPSPHEVRLVPLDTNPVFQRLEGGGKLLKTLHSQDRLVFVMTFWSCKENGLIRKIRLTAKFMASQIG